MFYFFDQFGEVGRYALGQPDAIQLLNQYFDVNSTFKQKIKKLIIDSITWYLQYRMESSDDSQWNMGSSVGGRVRGAEHELVHWCHGAPGWIPLFTRPEIQDELFSVGEKTLRGIEIAEKFGECVWTKGLLKKGLGLCHGIGGNGLVLYSIYDATGNQKESIFNIIIAMLINQSIWRKYRAPGKGRLFVPIIDWMKI